MKKLRLFIFPTVVSALLLMKGLAAADVTSSPTSPAGSTRQVQFNNNKKFGADSSFTYSTMTKTLSVPGVSASTISHITQLYFQDGSTQTTAATGVGGGGGGAGSSLEVFSNFGGGRSSPTASIGLSQAFTGTVSGSTYTLRINFSSVAAQSDLANYVLSSSAASTYLYAVSSTTFITISSAAATYLSQLGAASTYITLSSAAATYLYAGHIYVASITVNASLRQIGTNNAPNSAALLGIDCSSGTCLGPTIEVSEISDIATNYVSFSSFNANALTQSSATANYPTISSITANYMTLSSNTANDLKQSSAAVTYLYAAHIYVGSMTVDNSLAITGTNNAANAFPIVKVNYSSVTTQGPIVSSISAAIPILTSEVQPGVLGLSVVASSASAVMLVSSFPATTVTPGSYTNANVTFDAYGRATSASNGTAGGGGGASALAISTGTSSGYAGLAISSPTSTILFDLNTTNGQVLAGTTYFFSLKSSSVTLYGANIPAASISAGVIANNVRVSSVGAEVLVSSLQATGVVAASYTNMNATVDSQGRITTASNGSAGGGSSVYGATSTVVFGFGQSGSTATFTSTVTIGVAIPQLPSTPFSIGYNDNSPFGINIQNLSSGGLAASEYTATGDLGGPTTNFISMGINNSRNNDPIYTAMKASAPYILGGLNTTEMAIVSGSTNTNSGIAFYTGGSSATNKQMWITETGTVTVISKQFGIGGSTPSWTLTGSAGFLKTDGQTPPGFSFQVVNATDVGGGKLGATVIASSVGAAAVGLGQLSAIGTENNTTWMRGDNLFSVIKASDITGGVLANTVIVSSVGANQTIPSEVINGSSVTKQGPIVSSISASVPILPAEVQPGVLGTSVVASSASAIMLVSSFPAVNPNAGNWTNANVTTNAQGFITSITSGSVLGNNPIVNFSTFSQVIGTTVTATEVAVGTVTITPTFSTAKILVTADITYSKDTTTTARIIKLLIRRGSTSADVQVGTTMIDQSQAVALATGTISMTVVDLPNTLLLTTYTVRMQADAGQSTATICNIAAVQLTGGGIGDVVKTSTQTLSGVNTFTGASLFTNVSSFTVFGATVVIAGATNQNLIFSSSVFQVGTSTMMAWNDFAGHLEFHASTNPAVSSCGSAPVGLLALGANDMAGKITIGGSAPTACTLTFSNPWMLPPICTIASNTAITSPTVTTTNSTMVLGAGASFAGDVVMYHCVGNQP